MLIPVKWLKEYVDFEITTRELADKLTMSGSHVDSIENVDKGFTKVVVGKINKIEKHPDADRLRVTTIDVGEEEIQVVTNAQNVNEGDYVPVALVGAKLVDGLKIKKGKLRGVVSQGMLCSTQELGIPDNVVPKEIKDVVFIFDEKCSPGQDVKEVMGLHGAVIDFEITPNRPDCLSIIGMARETAATLEAELKYPNIKIENEEGNIEQYVESIEVKDYDLCKRYYGRVIKDVEIKSSPLWLQRRIMEAGVRPINNIVDITNYVMLEMGQPLHAFDLDKIKGKKVIVRKANENENVTTLDGEIRKLDASMLVIADDSEPIAVAGVMGGLDSEVSQDTKTILIESASFDGRNVRLTSRALGLRTEASSKFEKDLDSEMVEKACNRVCQLIEQIGAGKVVGGHIDNYDKKSEVKNITLRPEKVEKLLGVSIEVDRMIEILNNLEISAKLVDNKIETVIPTFRADLEIETDLIEEVGRVYGFHNIESKPLRGEVSRGEKTRSRRIEDEVKETLSGLGLNEITTYSFISPKAYDKINLSEDSMKRKCVELLNPLGEDYSVMRTTLIPNMLEVLARNYKHGIKQAEIYELGNIFIPKEIPVKGLPYENKTLCLGMYGACDFFDIKGLVESILENLNIKEYDYSREENYSTFHPGRTANIVKGNHVLGTIGELHPDVMEVYGIKDKVYIAELDFELLTTLTNLERKYKALPKFPATSRDIAIVVDEEVMVGDIEKVILENSGKIVEEVNLFDIYTGTQIEVGKKSVAYSITYRSHEKTLVDEEVSKVHDKIVEELKKTLNAEQR